MATIKEITHKYLLSKGMVLDGEGWVSPLMPYLIMDLFYDIYTKKVTTLALRHEQKRCCKDIARIYKQFNQMLFSPQDEDGKIVITDLMDELVDSTHNTLVKLKCAIMDCLSFEEYEIREIHASMLLADALTNLANGYWMECYRHRNRTAASNPLLESIASKMYWLMNAWHPVKATVNCSNDKKVSDLMKLLIKQVTNFCFSYDLPQKDQVQQPEDC